MDRAKYDNLEKERIKVRKELKKLERNFYPKQKVLKEKIEKIDELQRELVNQKLF
jgi:predicted  nucleic acid-binding Zn-ribbon protein